MSVISSCLTHATKIETQRGTLVAFLNTNGNALGQALTQEMEKLIIIIIIIIIIILIIKSQN